MVSFWLFAHAASQRPGHSNVAARAIGTSPRFRSASPLLEEQHRLRIRDGRILAQNLSKTRTKLGVKNRHHAILGLITSLHRRDVQEHRETPFFKGASLKDPSGLFNSSLEGNNRRAIDFHEDDEIDEKAFATLIRAAVSLNESSSR